MTRHRATEWLSQADRLAYESRSLLTVVRKLFRIILRLIWLILIRLLRLVRIILLLRLRLILTVVAPIRTSIVLIRIVIRIVSRFVMTGKVMSLTILFDELVSFLIMKHFSRIGIHLNVLDKPCSLLRSAIAIVLVIATDRINHL